MTQELFEALATQYREKAIELKARQEELDELKRRLVNEMEAREAEKAQAGLFEVRWQLVKGKRLDSAKLKGDHPDVYTACLVESETRRFSVA